MLTWPCSWWGFAAAWVDLDALALEESSAVAALLRDEYYFEVVAVNSSSPGVQVGTVIASRWVHKVWVCVLDSSGRASTWLDGCEGWGLWMDAFG